MRKKKDNSPKSGIIGRPPRIQIKNFAFDSMEQFEAIGKIPKSMQQWARDNGCPAFHHGRIYFLDFFVWLITTQSGDAANNWGKISDEMDAKLKMIKVGVELRDLIHKDEVADCLREFAGVCFDAIKRMTLEFPRNLEMRDRAFIKNAMADVYNEVLARAREELDKLKIQPIKERKNEPKNQMPHLTSTELDASHLQKNRA